MRRIIWIPVIFWAVTVTAQKPSGVIGVTTTPRNASDAMMTISDRAVSRKYILSWGEPYDGGLIMEKYENGQCQQTGEPKIFVRMTRLAGELSVDPQMLKTKVAFQFSSGFSAWSSLYLPYGETKVIWCDGKVTPGALNIPVAFIYSERPGEDKIASQMKDRLCDGIIASDKLYEAIESLPEKPLRYYVYCCKLIPIEP